MNNTALNKYLTPLQGIFSQEDVSEISINEPKIAWVEKGGDMVKYDVPELDFAHMKHLSQLIAQATEQSVSSEKPLLSATISSNGYRVQIILPPACEAGRVVMSIRKPSPVQLSLDDYEKMGAFESLAQGNNEGEKVNQLLQDCLQAGKIKEMLMVAVKAKKNIIVSGGTSTGKTTFTNAVLRNIPENERLITVEDAREIVLDKHENKVHLISSKGDQGRAKVDTQSLIESCLRLRPDRIIVGELRGAEAFSFLRAINTGHPGSISTLHADTPLMAIEQMKLMVMQAGLGISEEQIKNYIINVIDIVIQLKRHEKGKRYLSDILFTKSLLKS